MASDRVTMWAHRRWWVVPFLHAIFFPVWAVHLIAPAKADAMLEWAGTMIGRYGMKVGIGDAD